MILVDSLYINSSGGLRLLIYLIDELQDREVDFYLLADSRCMGIFDGCKHIRYMRASLWERKQFYRTNKHCFTTVLCFGNIPAPIELDVPVYTYFHNINLLTLSEAHSLKVKVVSWLKRELFKLYKNNTDYWFVQTSNTANELCKHLGESSERVKLMPFYDLPEELERINFEKHGEDYVFVSNYTGAKGHEELLEAWRLLHQQGIDRTLHLTVPFGCKEFCKLIEAARHEDLRIENHGFIPFEEVLELYRKSKAFICPSHNESLGLGIVEAATAGCDVIGADLPYIHSICKPSQVFKPESSSSIADAIMKYETENSEKTTVTIYNMIDEMIDMLTGE